MLDYLYQNEFVEKMGWVLLHSTWQIALLSCVYLGVKTATASAKTRYAAGVICMLLMLVAPLVTLSQIHTTPNHEHSLTSSASIQPDDLPAKSEDRLDPIPESFEPPPISVEPIANSDLAASNDSISSTVEKEQFDQPAALLAPTSPQGKTNWDQWTKTWRSELVALIRPFAPIAVLLWIAGMLL